MTQPILVSGALTSTSRPPPVYLAGAPVDGPGAHVIATGGLAQLVVRYTEEIGEVDDLLTLTGLRLLHERNG